MSHGSVDLCFASLGRRTYAFKSSMVKLTGIFHPSLSTQPFLRTSSSSCLIFSVCRIRFSYTNTQTQRNNFFLCQNSQILSVLQRPANYWISLGILTMAVCPEPNRWSMLKKGTKCQSQDVPKNGSDRSCISKNTIIYYIYIYIIIFIIIFFWCHLWPR